MASNANPCTSSFLDSLRQAEEGERTETPTPDAPGGVPGPPAGGGAARPGVGVGDPLLVEVPAACVSVKGNPFPGGQVVFSRPRWAFLLSSGGGIQIEIPVGIDGRHSPVTDDMHTSSRLFRNAGSASADQLNQAVVQKSTARITVTLKQVNDDPVAGQILRWIGAGQQQHDVTAKLQTLRERLLNKKNTDGMRRMLGAPTRVENALGSNTLMLVDPAPVPSDLAIGSVPCQAASMFATPGSNIVPHSTLHLEDMLTALQENDLARFTTTLLCGEGSPQGEYYLGTEEVLSPSILTKRSAQVLLIPQEQDSLAEFITTYLDLESPHLVIFSACSIARGVPGRLLIDMLNQQSHKNGTQWVASTDEVATAFAVTSEGALGMLPLGGVNDIDMYPSLWALRRSDSQVTLPCDHGKVHEFFKDDRNAVWFLFFSKATAVQTQRAWGKFLALMAQEEAGGGGVTGMTLKGLLDTNFHTKKGDDQGESLHALYRESNEAPVGGTDPEEWMKEWKPRPSNSRAARPKPDLAYNVVDGLEKFEGAIISYEGRFFSPDDEDADVDEEWKGFYGRSSDRL